MDIQRLVLFMIFAFSLLILWEAWQRDQSPAPVAQQGSGAGAPAAQPPAEPPVPSLPAPAAPVPGAGPPAAGGVRVSVRTDVLVAEISAVGGDLVRLELSQYADKEDRAKRFVLLDQQAARTYVVQTGLIGEGLPNHKTVYSVLPGEREIKPGAETLELRLAAPEAGGVKVSKVYTFRRGSYLVELHYELENAGASPVSAHAYFQFLRDGNPAPGDTKMVPTYTGAAVYTEQSKFHKVDFSAMEKGKSEYPKNADNGWLAMIQHYFVAARRSGNSSPARWGRTCTAPASSFPSRRWRRGRRARWRCRCMPGPRSRTSWRSSRRGSTWWWTMAGSRSWPCPCSGCWTCSTSGRETGAWPSSCSPC